MHVCPASTDDTTGLTGLSVQVAPRVSLLPSRPRPTTSLWPS